MMNRDIPLGAIGSRAGQLGGRGLIRSGRCSLAPTSLSIGFS